MNTIQVKIAKAKIRSRGYWERRRQQMIRLGWDCEQHAAWSYRDAKPGYYLHWESKANMYRKRASWYVRKQINEIIIIKENDKEDN